MNKDERAKKIPTKRVTSWNEFRDLIEGHKYREWIYRGQSDAEWDLKSSLYRHVSEVKRSSCKGQIRSMKYEKHLLSKFKQHANLYIEKTPSKGNDAEWLSLMQHHGVPTRLLDWSFSPYIASYFASECGIKDFSVFCMKQTEFVEMDEKYFKGEDISELRRNFLKSPCSKEKKMIFPYEPKFKHKRVVAQQGVFTIPTVNNFPYTDSLFEYELEGIFFQIIIPTNMRSEWSKKLQQMNINAATLFPDLDGFCRSLKNDIYYTISSLKDIR